MNKIEQQTDILLYTQKHFDRSKTLGLQILIYLSLREQTSIAYQHKEMGFTDIPLKIVLSCDALSEEEQMFLAAQLADELFEDSLFIVTEQDAQVTAKDKSDACGNVQGTNALHPSTTRAIAIASSLVIKEIV